MDPGAFVDDEEGDEELVNEGPRRWTVFSVEYDSNPISLIEDFDQWQMLINIWSQCRGDFGNAHFPDSGGAVDQSCWVMEAFALLERYYQILRKESEESKERERRRKQREELMYGTTKDNNPE